MKTAKIDVKDRRSLGTLRDFLRSILQLEDISAILVPQHLPMKNVVMPTLVTDPNHLNGVDPLAPVFPMNAAKIVSRLTRKPMGAKVAVVLRPCEIRAFVELVKLKQGRTDEVVLIGIDCLGAFQTKIIFSWWSRTQQNPRLGFTSTRCSGKKRRLETLIWRRPAGPANIRWLKMLIF